MMREPRIDHHFSDGLYAKEMRIPAGFAVMQHKHTYDHLGMLARGLVKVTCDGEVRSYTAPACINIKAGAHHRIDALVDSVWYCIHATDETDAEKVDETLIKKD